MSGRAFFFIAFFFMGGICFLHFLRNPAALESYKIEHKKRTEMAFLYAGIAFLYAEIRIMSAEMSFMSEEIAITPRETHII